MSKLAKPPGVMLYFDALPCLKRLSDAQAGRLFKSILLYGQDGVEPELDDDMALGVAWDYIKPRLDRDKDHYGEVSETRRQASREYWTKIKMDSNESKRIQMDSNDIHVIPTSTTTSTTKDIDLSPQAATNQKNVIPPSIDEIRAYINEHGYSVSPEQFHDFYTARGWCVGKTKMRDWRAALRGWQRREPPSISGDSDYYKNTEGSL